MLPHPQHWILLPALGAVVVLVLGLMVRFVPGIAAAEVHVDIWLTYHQSGFASGLALAIETLFSPAGCVAILAISFVFLLLVRRSPVNAFAFASVAAFGYLSCEVFKAAVSMPRPNGNLMSHPLLAETGHDSFPSGHTTFAVSFAIAAVLLSRNTHWFTLTVVLGSLFALVVAVSRMYVGAHYLTDVLGSAVVAAVAISFYGGLWSRFGLTVLRWLPLLRRIGPVPAPSLVAGASGTRATRTDASAR